MEWPAKSTAGAAVEVRQIPSTLLQIALAVQFLAGPGEANHLSAATDYVALRREPPALSQHRFNVAQIQSDRHDDFLEMVGDAWVLGFQHRALRLTQDLQRQLELRQELIQ